MPSSLHPRIQVLITLAIVLIACWFLLFNQLGSAPLRFWDESRLAINAIEMSESGRLLVTTYEGQPDAWNTKPPLMIWLQALAIKLFGIGLVPLRLPAALAALATVMSLYFFLGKRLSPWSGLAAAMALLATPGYVMVHCARNGEYDSLLVLWMFASSLTFLRVIERTEEKKWIWLTALFVTLAVYAKGVQGLIHIPGLVLFAAVRGRLGVLLKHRHLLLAGIASIFVIAAYYLAREAAQPGYLEAVMNNELIGRYSRVSEGHRGDMWTYFEALKFWSPVGGAMVVLTLFLRGKHRRIAWFGLLLSLTYVLIISIGKSKLVWYAVPMFPWLSISLGACAAGVVHFAQRQTGSRVAGPARWFIILALIGWFDVQLFRQIESGVGSLHREEAYGLQLMAYREAFPESSQLYLVNKDYDPLALYYKHWYATKGLSIRPLEVKSRPSDLRESMRIYRIRSGDTVLTSSEDIIQVLDSLFDHEVFFTYLGLEATTIKGRQ